MKLLDFSEIPIPFSRKGVPSWYNNNEVFIELDECKRFQTIFIETRRSVPPELLRLGLAALKYRKSIGQKATNSLNLSLSRIEKTSEGSLFVFQPVTYAASIGSNGSLDTVLPDGQTVEQKYGGLDSMKTISEYNNSVLAKMVGISTLIISADNKVLLTQRSPKVAVEPNSFHITLPEGMSCRDIDDTGHISPVDAVIRGIHEEIADPGKTLPLIVDPKMIKLLGLGISTKYRQPEFAALARLPYSANYITKGAEKARDRWERKSIVAYDFSSKVLVPLLTDRQWSPHGFYALYKALKAEGLL